MVSSKRRRSQGKQSPSRRSIEATFKPRARMLQLLGDQLIRDPHIAVFELLKNAYDADATDVVVTLKDVEHPENASIVVEDDGSGMTFDTVLNVWLEPGTDFRARQRSKGQRSPLHRRLPMGEKGIGRFAVHKLGMEVELVTRAESGGEVIVQLDWDAIEEKEYLSEAALQVTERDPAVFVDHTGTRITVTRLRQPWTRGVARALRRSVTAMTSPFHEVSSFNPQLILDPDPQWFDGLLDPSDVIKSALFHASAKVDPGRWVMSYDYEFAPQGFGRRLEPRKVSQTDVHLGPRKDSRRESRYLGSLANLACESRKQVQSADNGIGGFTVDLHIFDLDRETRELSPVDYRGVVDFLNTNGGVRVYRDGIRVYDYGEPDSDWLDLDARRVNLPAQRVSNNLVVGAVHLNSRKSRGLVEKTNREGFVESPAYVMFRSAVQSAIQHIVFERNRDKQSLRRLVGRRRDTTEPVTGALRRLRSRVRRLGMLVELGPLIDRAEEEYESFRETLLVSAGAGLTMTVVVHEVEKGIKELNRALDRRAGRKRLMELGLHLAEVVESLGYVARRSDQTNERASELVSVALRTIDYRFSDHEVEVRNGFDEDNDFMVKVKRRLIVGTLMNLFDNAIYWLDAKSPRHKRLYVGPTRELGDGGGILVADNGPGFLDPHDFLVQPFTTRKSDGMGLGLYISNEVMRAHGGWLLFPSPGEVDLPSGYQGACAVLLFKE